MLDFGALPPEINSARMYSGPGAGPMLAAAAAWDALSAALSTTATGYVSIVAELTGNAWLGPASLAMATAVAPYVAWLHGTAGQAERTAAQAKMAAAAYELAFAATVPPSVIAANRSLLLTLVATNFFGQNSTAIAATEAQYTQMWLQDATAMYGYAAASASAGRLAPFPEPPQTTDPAELVAAPIVAADPLSVSTLLVTGISATKVVNTVMSTTSSAVSARGILIVDERLAAGEEPAAEVRGALGGLAVPGAAAHRAGATVSVGIGRAGSVGKLSVPAGWVTAAAEVRPTALTVPAAAEVPAGMPGEIPVSGSVFSQSVLGTLSRDGPDAPRRTSKPIIVRSPAAG